MFNQCIFDNLVNILDNSYDKNEVAYVQKISWDILRAVEITLSFRYLTEKINQDLQRGTTAFLTVGNTPRVKCIARAIEITMPRDLFRGELGGFIAWRPPEVEVIVITNYIPLTPEEEFIATIRGIEFEKQF